MSVDYTQMVYVNRIHIQAIRKTDDFCNCNSNIRIISKENPELRVHGWGQITDIYEENE